jgi:hypothetical protein
MVEPRSILHVPDLLLAVALGTDAVLSVLAPLFGVGWGIWVAYLLCATVGLALSMRYVWSR